MRFKIMKRLNADNYFFIMVLIAIILAILTVWKSVSPKDFLETRVFVSLILEILRFFDKLPVHFAFWTIISISIFATFKAIKLFSFVKLNLSGEQKKLHATLIGNLANIILGASAVSFSIKYNSIRIPDRNDLTDEQLYDILGNLMVIVGGVVLWIVLHDHALSFISDENSSKNRDVSAALNSTSAETSPTE